MTAGGEKDAGGGSVAHGGASQKPALRLIPDKYLLVIVWGVLFVAYTVFTLLGRESKVIEGMLGAAFGALILALQSGFKRIEDAIARRRDGAHER